MNTASGIHVTENAIRAVCVEKQGEQYLCKALSHQKLTKPVHLAPDRDLPQTIVEAFIQTIETLPDLVGQVSFALTGGYYHLQKIPLEVAGTDERREQIEWEADQALISPTEDVQIDFVPSGRVAFWTAIRKNIIQVYETLLAPLGEISIHFTVAPLALFYAGIPGSIWQTGRHAAIHLSPFWSSFVAVENGVLTAAETVRAIDHNNAQIQQIRQWISEDLASSRPPYQNVYLSGNTSEIDIDEIGQSSDILLTEYPTFQDIDITQLAADAQNQLDHPNKYAIALGAALHCLSQDESS